MHKFEQLGLSPIALEAIKIKGFTEPTEIQQKTIPMLLQTDQDIIAQAQTGTGKTATFGLVFVDKLEPNKKKPQAIVLAPTRELAVQVSEEINSLKGKKRLTIVPIYGGQSITMQRNQLRRGVDVVVGTPGRVLDHLKNGYLDLSEIKYMVLDEADEMLNMGFVDDIEEVITFANPDKQTLLFSATMPQRIKSLAKRYLKNQTMIAAKQDRLTNNLVEQIYFEVKQRDKFDALCRIIDIEDNFYGIIFCRTKVNVDSITKHLTDRGYKAEAIHGDVVQKKREHILNNFKKQKTMIMVATDVAARGIDVNNLSHVINYSLPQNPESYVHRVGRTGRAGNKGTAISFVTSSERRQLSFIKRISKAEITKKQLPDADKIITIKKKKIAEDIFTILQEDKLDLYKEFAKILTDEMDPVDIVSALLKYKFSEQLDKNNYKKIDTSSRSSSSNQRGATRLFITTGRQDGMTPQKLVNGIEKKDRSKTKSYG